VALGADGDATAVSLVRRGRAGLLVWRRCGRRQPAQHYRVVVIGGQIVDARGKMIGRIREWCTAAPCDGHEKCKSCPVHRDTRAGLVGTALLLADQVFRAAPDRRAARHLGVAFTDHQDARAAFGTRKRPQVLFGNRKRTPRS